jgi:PAS domain S-box-containing protein
VVVPPDVPEPGTELEEFFDLSIDPLSIIGLDGEFKHVNPSFLHLLGYTKPELFSRTALDVLHPDDVEPAREALAQLAEGHDLARFEARVVCADGAVRWLEWSTRSMPERGVLYSVGRDTTERRRADAELREAQRLLEASRDELRVLAEEQAALRRVAALVAQNAAPPEIFAAVSAEVDRVFGFDPATLDVAGVVRFEPGPEHLVVGVSKSVEAVALGSRFPPDVLFAPTDVLRTGRSARIGEDDLASVGGEVADFLRHHGYLSQVASPIVVDGRLWGAISVNSRNDFPPDTEERLGRFTELVATAIANAESLDKRARLADEQAALRRVATLVAQGASPEDLFEAVAEEVGRLLHVESGTMGRFEPDGSVTSVASWSTTEALAFPTGMRWPTGGTNVAWMVLQTGRSARIDDFSAATDPIGVAVREAGIKSAVGSPIIVEGDLWGLVAAASTEGPLPPDTDARLASFTELVATAIANAQSSAELISSRARLLTAGDEARRRVVRDLHDGAQQRLVLAIVTLKLAQRAARDNDGEVESLLSEALEQAEQGNRELRELAHGILPAVLTRGGLRAGVDAFVARLDLPVAIDVPAERLPAELEASAYFIVAEGLTNVMKHAQATRAEVKASVDDGLLQVEVRDDGIGGADPSGHGLVGMADRVSALGGKLSLQSPARGGTVVTATLPLPAA